MHGNGHAGFGGRPAETDQWQHRHRAAGRPHTFRLASKKDWDALKRDVAPIYTATNAAAARSALDDLTDRWGKKYAAIVRLWENAWTEFIPFLDYDIEIRKVICSTDESVKPCVVVGAPAMGASYWRPGAAVKVERPTGRTTLTAARTAVASGAAG